MSLLCRAPKNCGEIVFYDPRLPQYFHPKSTKPNSLNAMQNSVNPWRKILSSYLDHSVNPNLSNEERIVISFNINLIKK